MCRLLLKRYTLVRFPVVSNRRQKIGIRNFSDWRSAIKKDRCEVCIVCGRQVGRWQLDSKTMKVRPYAASWQCNLVDKDLITIKLNVIYYRTVYLICQNASSASVAIAG